MGNQQVRYICLLNMKGDNMRTKWTEEKIINYLNNNKIIYERQKVYPSLKGEGGCNLSYDFYLPDYNCCIEYQGVQHYEPVKYFGGKEKFEIQRKHDLKKKNYCTENKIKLITIPYWEFDNIETVLNEKIINKLD